MVNFGLFRMIFSWAEADVLSDGVRFEFAILTPRCGYVRNPPHIDGLA